MTPRRKKGWEVTLFLTETEGDRQKVTKTWYERDDVKQLIAHQLHKAGIMRDLKLLWIYAVESSEPYSDDDITAGMPF